MSYLEAVATQLKRFGVNQSSLGGDTGGVVEKKLRHRRHRCRNKNLTNLEPFDEASPNALVDAGSAQRTLLPFSPYFRDYTQAATYYKHVVTKESRWASAEDTVWGLFPALN